MRLKSALRAFVTTLAAGLMALTCQAWAYEEAGRATSIAASPWDGIRVSFLADDIRLTPLPSDTVESPSTAGTEASKPEPSTLVAPLEVLGFHLSLNGLARVLKSREKENGKRVYAVTPSSIWNNLTQEKWTVDNDAFKVNQLHHPYQGSVYHGIARSMGLDYWKAAGYAFAGSLLWEIAGETTRPSYNDQVASGIAGSFFGEPLFRIASILLEGRETPGRWREFGAALICPPLGLNRFVFGDKLPVFPSHDPALFWRMRGGGTTYVYLQDNSRQRQTSQSEASGDFLLLYGLPGKPGYHYDRPFDFFRFELTAAGKTNDPIENIVTRGSLFAKAYDVGNAYRGIWGIYGSYDYLSPHLFRLSTTAISLGSTAQWWLSRSAALQGSALAGAGYGGGADIAKATRGGYQYGIAGQTLISLRLTLSDLMMLEGNGRLFYLSGLASNHPHSSQTITRLGIGLTVRLRGPHGISLQYLDSSRRVSDTGTHRRRQKAAAITLSYSWINDESFGAVRWEKPENGR